MSVSPDHPSVTGPADPEHDPLATYAVEPELVRALTDRIVSTTGRSEQTTTPLTGQPLATIPQSSADDVATAYERARRAQRSWARTSLDERAAAMLRLHDLVLDRQDEAIDLLCWETGKARKHAFDEVLHVALTARYLGRTAHRHLARERRPGVVPVLTRVEVNHLPEGVVGIVVPWNYPFTLALCDGLAALLAGNAVVTKADAQTMLSGLFGARLLEEAGFPADLWNVVAGPGPEIGGAVVEHADHVCFTGSTATGRAIARRCVERLVPCSLELGGKNPFLVLRDADVDRAAEGAVRACFSNSGQLCVSAERLYVADQVYERFVDALVRRVEAMRLSAGLAWDNDMGPLISRAQLERVAAHVDDAVAKGATVLAGGRARPELAPTFYEPTVLEHVTPAMDCFAEETFGPVVSVHRFHDEADAVARANEGDYGLNASVYSRDTGRARRLAAQVRCGTVNVNEGFAATFASIDAPMGGMRHSGLGRRQGAEGVRRFTETQSVAVQLGIRFAPMFGMSEETFAKVMTANLRLLKRLGRA